MSSRLQVVMAASALALAAVADFIPSTSEKQMKKTPADRAGRHGEARRSAAQEKRQRRADKLQRLAAKEKS